MTLMRPMLVALVVLGACVALPAVAAWPAGEPQFSSEPDGSPAYTSFVRHLNANIHAWWQRDGQRQVSPSQRWRIIVVEVGLGPQSGVAVGVQKLGAPLGATTLRGEWSPKEVFVFYPLFNQFVEPGAAAATAAVIEFLQGKALGTAAEEEQKR